MTPWTPSSLILALIRFRQRTDQPQAETVALSYPEHQDRLCHPQLSPEDPLDNLYPLLIFHCQDYGLFHTLT